ncbi:hypothetical protein BC832DRAFT_623514 [Gaertneriomyces semiglobifer]|nr:hypothetical protein BC832DRAFT_623514 [Gaertneriomyces semiglobifer]
MFRLVSALILLLIASAGLGVEGFVLPWNGLRLGPRRPPTSTAYIVSPTFSFITVTETETIITVTETPTPSPTSANLITSIVTVTPTKTSITSQNLITSIVTVTPTKTSVTSQNLITSIVTVTPTKTSITSQNLITSIVTVTPTKTSVTSQNLITSIVTVTQAKSTSVYTTVITSQNLVTTLTPSPTSTAPQPTSTNVNCQVTRDPLIDSEIRAVMTEHYNSIVNYTDVVATLNDQEASNQAVMAMLTVGQHFTTFLDKWFPGQNQLVAGAQDAFSARVIAISKLIQDNESNNNNDFQNVYDNDLTNAEQYLAGNITALSSANFDASTIYTMFITHENLHLNASEALFTNNFVGADLSSTQAFNEAISISDYLATGTTAFVCSQ